MFETVVSLALNLLLICINKHGVLYERYCGLVLPTVHEFVSDLTCIRTKTISVSCRFNFKSENEFPVSICVVHESFKQNHFTICLYTICLYITARPSTLSLIYETIRAYLCGRVSNVLQYTACFLPSFDFHNPSN